MISFEKTVIVYNQDVEESYLTACAAAKIFGGELITPEQFSDEASFVITAGGDGTILNAARFYAKKGVPILGINLGRLGFLAQANTDELSWAAEKLHSGDYKIEDRMMLSVCEEKVSALNDIVVKGDSFSRTSRLYLSINGEPVCDYLADGLIVATPTGSTAYTLSAGGPVVEPRLEAIVIVPICAHTLTSRPLVIPSDDIVEISSCDNCEKLRLSADGQNTLEVMQGETISIRKSSVRAKLVVLNRDGFYNVLRRKLQWGVSPKSI